MKVPASSIGPHYFLSVRSSFVDPSTQELIYPKEQVVLVPRPQAAGSSTPSIQRLRNLHLTTRATAVARRLIENNDLAGAYELLSSTRALVMKSSERSASFYARGLEAELIELQRRRQQQKHRESGEMEEKPELLTPTSAWRAAERLAKVAITRKHMNRVSDLHGFENARF
ncbi:serine/threonine-protein kinase nek3-like [Tripterygium wilfordii]|uniref:Serine/threonine-protein kinase nek3-like n=1 Tax=Tripterygium wilfordii TaxID=458696 RepID=A0A7J7CVX6_TRIWF|nr:serine/threonine-protein kinase nek3-like [Tripterygium wilfordii]